MSDQFTEKITVKDEWRVHGVQFRLVDKGAGPMIRHFKNGFCVGVGGEKWTCVETGSRITFKIYLGKWIVTWDTSDFLRSNR